MTEEGARHPWHLPPGILIQVALGEVLDRWEDLADQVVVFLPTGQDEFPYTLSTRIGLADQGIEEEHLVLNAAEDLYVLPFEPLEGFVSTYNVDSWRDQLYFDTFHAERTPLEHFNARVTDWKLLDPQQGIFGIPRLGPRAIEYMWNGQQPGWVVLRVPGLTPILYHKPTRTPFATKAVNLDELIEVALDHGVPVFDQRLQ